MSKETFLAKILLSDTGFGDRFFSNILTAMNLSMELLKNFSLKVLSLSSGVFSFFGGI